MIRTAVLPTETDPSPQVFVDATGRRKRLLAISGFLVGLFAAFYIAVVGASVVQAASDSGLTTKATVSTSATVSASASTSGPSS